MTSNARPSQRPLVVIQRNPRSGSGKAKGELRRLSRKLKSHGFHVRMFSNRERLDEFVHSSAIAPVAIVAAGGDGTVGNVANRLPDLPIAILPLGTENLLAKYLKIPRDGEALADVIAAGKTVTLDTATVNQQRFLIMAGFGLDAAVVHRMDEVRTGTISHLSYIQPIVRTFRKYKYVPLRVYVDGQEDAITGYQVMIVNLPAYALGMPFAESATGTDGKLDVRVFDGGSSFQMVKYCYKVARRQHEQLAGVHCLTARSVRIESDEPAFAQVDGDPAGFTPATVEVQPASITYFVP
ncbi:MAG: diacylglycerol kinase family protein [Planctomycetaceae bacterium]